MRSINLALLAAELALLAAQASALTIPVGCPPPLAEIPVGTEIEGYRSTHAFQARRLSVYPGAFLLRNFLSEDECSAIMAAAEESGEFKLAETGGRTDARKRCDICCLGMQTPVVNYLTNEVRQLLLDPEAAASPGSGCEDMHVLRYAAPTDDEPGGSFLPHYDATSSPRVLTILYYLNGEGATWFPIADAPVSFNNRAEVVAHVNGLDPQSEGLLVEPSAPGDALAFFNYDHAGDPEPHSLHAGLEVTTTKWVASHFFHVPAVVARRETEAMATRDRRMAFVREERERRQEEEEQSGATSMRVGDAIEVEVEDEGHVSWRPAEVRELLRGRRFAACIDADEGFIEEIAMAEEGVEWRR